MMRHVFIKKRNGTLDVTWHDTPEKLHPLFFLLGRGEIKSHLFTKAKANTTRPSHTRFSNFGYAVQIRRTSVKVSIPFLNISHFKDSNMDYIQSTLKHVIRPRKGKRRQGLHTIDCVRNPSRIT